MQGSSGGNPGAPAPRRDPHPSSADRVWFRKRRKVMAFLLPPIDGRGAHPDAPELDGAAGGPMTRLTGANFADDQRTPVDGPGAREISNVVFGEGDPDVPNPEGISYLANGFGQFVAHDLAATAGDKLTHLAIAGPRGDASFAPRGTIDVTRLPGERGADQPGHLGGRPRAGLWSRRGDPGHAACPRRQAAPVAGRRQPADRPERRLLAGRRRPRAGEPGPGLHARAVGQE